MVGEINYVRPFLGIFCSRKMKEARCIKKRVSTKWILSGGGFRKISWVYFFKRRGMCVYMYKISGKICKKQVILADFGEGIWITRQKWNKGGFSLYIFGTFEL